MSWITRIGSLVFGLLLLAPARAEEAQPGDLVTWSKDLPTAFATAKAEQKILMICVNAKHVAGRAGEEPAAKGLREVVYKDARVVEKSREFVCVLLTPEGNSADYGELRAIGIEGDIVSPQHVFVHPDGKEILVRKEYWSYGSAEPAVKALLDMMEKAQRKSKGESAEPEPPPSPDDAGPAPEGAARVEWIARKVEEVVEGGGRKTEEALEVLVRNDRDGDCTGPLVALLPEHEKNVFLLGALIRALGRDGLSSAALPIADQLGHKDNSIRGNAAVSLEYIGCGEKKVVGALRKAVGKEKDQAIANHMYRALGRCGVQDGKVRALLLKKADGAKSEFASYGPAIGLAYFVGDAKAARGVEKMLKKIGVPGGRRGGGQNTVKRGLLSWTLAAIGDEKSGKFMREELLAKLDNVKAFWVGGLRAFYGSVARKCDGDDSEMAGIEGGVRGFVAFARQADLGRYGAETRNLMDDCRKDRDTATFRPKGDNLLDTGDDR